VKVTVVGGGSTYTPELVDGIARLQQMFGVDELVLTDPAEQRLAPESQNASSPGTGTPGTSHSRLILITQWRMPQSFCSS
jgi:hypothetical protein